MFIITVTAAATRRNRKSMFTNCEPCYWHKDHDYYECVDCYPPHKDGFCDNNIGECEDTARSEHIGNDCKPVEMLH